MNTLTIKQLDELDPEWCWWFVGLVDGEGCFDLWSSPRGGHRHTKEYGTRLTIVQRDDNQAMLKEIRDTFGRGHCYPHREVARNRHNTYVLYFITANDTRFLVAFFKKYPLQGKKKLDFEIWAAAREELDKPPKARDEKRLRHLARAIKDVRKYEPPVTEPYEPEGKQLTLQECVRQN